MSGYNSSKSNANDKSIVKCPFYEKIGACRHGPLCSRRHVKPLNSNTVVFWKLFENPLTEEEQRELNNGGGDHTTNRNSQYKFKVLTKEELNRYIDEFFTDLYIELIGYGEIAEIGICCNRNAHLTGNVYVRFSNPDSAQICVSKCNDRWYDERPIYCELSPVSSISEASCGEYLRSKRCSRGSLCNFMHIRTPSREAALKLYQWNQTKK